MTEPVLRAATPADGPFLLRVYASTRAEELTLVDWDDAQKEAFVGMQFDAQSRHYGQHFGDAAFDVVEVDGDPAGRLIVDRRPDAIHIIDIALLPEHRGHGVGTTLLQAILAEADGAAKPVTIHVERFNRAQGLYGRLGFEVVADEGVYLLLRRQPQVKTAS